MISDEKMVHIVHLLMDGLEKDRMVTFQDKAAAVREAKKAAMGYLKQIAQCADLARARITSQKKPPPEYSQEWEILFEKYYEDELKKKGG